VVTRGGAPGNDLEGAREIAAAVPDPELPMVTVADLGILRDVAAEDGHLVVTITPTYSGCPAMDAIRQDILAALANDGYDDVQVHTVLAPAWTTDWITAAGRRKLKEYGIAPPSPDRKPGIVSLTLGLRTPASEVACPQCGATQTREVSRFGSTACKAQYVCDSCREPFDYFKVL